MKWILKKCIGLYRTAISPIVLSLGGNCRFYPTCSEYAKDALNKHSLHRALALVAWRVIRCNPWCEGGIDLVPDHDMR